MKASEGRHPPWSRLLLSALSGGCFAFAALSLAKALAESRRQGWGELGWSWLTLDVWSRTVRFEGESQGEWKGAAAAALLTLLLSALATSAWGRRQRALGVVRLMHRIASSPPVFLLLAAIAFVLPRGAARVARPTPNAGAPNVLMVMIDSLRADHVGWLAPERTTTPKLDALVTQGVIYENVLTVAPWTAPSVATLLTGVTPSWHRMVSNVVPGTRSRGTRLAADRLTWLEILAAAGFDTAMWTNNPNVREQSGFAQGVRHLVDYTTDPRRGPRFKPGPVETVLADVRQWLQHDADASRPFAAYVHLMEPHYPHDAPAPFKGTFERGACDVELTGILYRDALLKPDVRSSITPEVGAHLEARYDEEILRMDACLGPFLEELRRERPNTVVVLVADHGEEFLDHGLLGHSHSVYQELLRVPLVIWAPQLEPKRVSWQVRSLDVAPTILELAGVAAPPSSPMPMQGESLVDVEPRHRLAPFEAGGEVFPPFQLRGASDGVFKVVRRLPNQPPQGGIVVPVLDARLEGERGEKIPFDCLFNVQLDPGERDPHAVDEGGVAERLWAEMKAREWYFSESAVLDASAVAEPLDDEQVDLLRRLGYVGR